MKLKPPTPAQIRAAREAARMTQAEAAALVHLIGAKRWSAYETGASKIDLAHWELFVLKATHIQQLREIVGNEPAVTRKGRPPSWAVAKPAKKPKSSRK